MSAPTTTAPLPPREAAWWKGDRDRCPACGSEDVGTWGHTPERTDANVADLAACEACSWGSEPPREQAEAEAITNQGRGYNGVRAVVDAIERDRDHEADAMTFAEMQAELIRLLELL